MCLEKLHSLVVSVADQLSQYNIVCALVCCIANTNDCDSSTVKALLCVLLR